MLGIDVAIEVSLGGVSRGAVGALKWTGVVLGMMVVVANVFSHVGQAQVIEQVWLDGPEIWEIVDVDFDEVGLGEPLSDSACSAWKTS